MQKLGILLINCLQIMAATLTTFEFADAGINRFKELISSIRTSLAKVAMMRPKRILARMFDAYRNCVAVEQTLEKGLIKELKWVLLFNQFAWL